MSLIISHPRAVNSQQSSTDITAENELAFSKASITIKRVTINPLKPELNPICYLLALLGANHFLHVSRIRVKLLTLR